MAANGPRIDLVYTWVDDSWPGYLEELGRYANKEQDSNPNRTRDNLDLLRYSLRSVARYAPWLGNVYLLSMRPQVPRWLDTGHPRLRIVHHDQIMDPALLPTFNSFAIVSHLHKLPGVSSPFLYLEDDMLFGAEVSPADFMDAAGRPRLFPQRQRTPDATQRERRDISPWNAALARANHLLDGRFGVDARRRHVNHVPLLVDPELWRETLEQWPEAIAHTRASRFRDVGNVPPEYLYPYYALASGRASSAPPASVRHDFFYFPLENWRLHARFCTTWVDWRRPRFMTLNDNFGTDPNPAVVTHLKRTLERWYPDPSPFEKR
jgi:hypothetical protein